MQLGEEGLADLRDAIAVGIAQERDALGARNPGPGALHGALHDEAFDALALVRPLRCVRLRDEHVPVWKDIEPARMIETLRECDDPGASRRDRRRTGRPALGGRNLD